MLNLTFKEKYQLLKEQKNSHEIIIKPIYPKAPEGIIGRLYTGLYNYYKLVLSMYSIECGSIIDYYYLRFLYTITLYFFCCLYLFCEYNLEEK